MIDIIFHNTSEQTKSLINQFIDEWNNENEYFFSSTSGSTGSPKTIKIKKEHAMNSARMTHDFLKLSSGNTALVCLPISSIAAKMMVIRSIVNNYTLHVVEPSADPMKDLNPKVQIDFAAFVPMQVAQMIKNNRNRFRSIGTIIIGGAAINNGLWEEISEAHNNAYQTFGMTETISHIAMRKINKERPPYQLMKGVQIDRDDRLTIHSEELGVDRLKTNDLIQFIDKKSFEWVGRIDSIINSGGHKIHPEQIEEKLGDLIRCSFFSYGLKDDFLGEKHVLIIEGHLRIHKADLSNRLDRKDMPKEIYFLQNFNYTHSNKVDRIKTIARIPHAEKQVL